MKWFFHEKCNMLSLNDVWNKVQKVLLFSISLALATIGAQLVLHVLEIEYSCHCLIIDCIVDRPWLFLNWSQKFLPYTHQPFMPFVVSL